ncbi:(2Fe-2S)-binding protein [Roseomonas chloroacetimidivorans]|uniref:(2Fe-2S)-binding protein n=1 Tax=Roseomonas chloroacetimidivorans TaxID=1766656 RepID=UPI003C750C90
MSEERFRIAVTVNGSPNQAEVPARLSLADLLRDELRLTGTHLGCEHGACGACTVLVDGISARACLMLAVQADGRSITTVEGLEQAGRLHPLQQALSDHHGLQCGFCTPGVLMTLVELLEASPAPSEAEIRMALAGHHCRCTGYQGMVEAVLSLSGRVLPGG